MPKARIAFLLFAIVTLAANSCGCESASKADAGLGDAGVIDAGAPDAGASDAGSVDAGLDGGLVADAGELDGGHDAGVPDGGPDGGVDAGFVDSGVNPVACATCEDTHLANGDCEMDAGCGWLTGQQRVLCDNLFNCMRATQCWRAGGPLDCFCGTATGMSCATGSANGHCKQEVQAATGSLDPIENGTRFYDFRFPAAAAATTLIACDYDQCQSVCP
jgi:hypothetical protein